MANIKPLPAYVKRIISADVKQGEVNGLFQIWPTARPMITVEAGERLTLGLRIRALGPDAGSLKLGPTAPETWKLRREPSGDYWLDIPIDAVTQNFSRNAPLIVEQSGGQSREMRIRLVVNVPAENVVATPAELDFGDIAVADADLVLKRLGVRKIVGSFHVKTVTSTLPFLKLEQVTIIDGSNYLIRITIDTSKPLKPGAYDGKVVVDCDDGKRVEVPVKVKLVAK